MTRSTSTPEWGSDAIALFLRRAGIDYVALNPGASYRGLHDSLVNYLHDEQPQMLMTLHEEHAVAIAHGYAKVTGRPMAVALHSNVGLMHASMAIFNAYADRMPMLIIGAAGPFDAAARRPWIDWLHTTADQPAIVRSFIKWDDSPMSIEATLESLARGWELTRAAPRAPVYIVLDSTVQEQLLDQEPPQPRIGLDDAWSPAPAAVALDAAVEMLSSARAPIMLAGRTGLDEQDFRRRIELAERIGARVITDLKAGSSFPTGHPLHVPGSGYFLSDEGMSALSASDVVLGLDWIDLAGTLRQAPAAGQRRVISATLDPYLHNGWSKDHFARVDADIWLTAEPATAVAGILDRLSGTSKGRLPAPSAVPSTPVRVTEEAVTLESLAAAMRRSLATQPVTLVRLPLGWDAEHWPFESPLDFLGYDGGGGIGSGPGMTVGAALGLKSTDRIAVSILGDGDFLMGASAVWTAAKYRIPALIVVANNRSYFNDEVHQEEIATMRSRDTSRKWIGQRIDDPAPNIAAIARGHGATAYGPLQYAFEVREVLQEAVQRVAKGDTVVVDVHVQVGYSNQMTSGLVRGPERDRNRVARVEDDH